jgi:hypothetical protein
MSVMMRTAMHRCPFHQRRGHTRAEWMWGVQGMSGASAWATGVRCASRLCTIEASSMTDNSGDSGNRRVHRDRMAVPINRSQ